MTIPLAADDGTMIADLAHFDLAREMAEFDHHNPKGIRAKSRLFKTKAFRVILICMEAAAQIKEHHADGTSSVRVLKGPSITKHRGKYTTCRLEASLLLALRSSTTLKQSLNRGSADHLMAR